MTDTIPRLMLMGLSERACLDPVLLGLTAAFGRNSWQPQVYTDTASPEMVDCTQPLYGLAMRHLDLWVLGPERCYEIFARTAAMVDIALIRCDFNPERNPLQWRLAECLDTPVIAVVHASDLDRGIPLTPPLPRPPDGVLVTGVSRQDPRTLSQRALSIAQAPFIGAISQDAVTQATRQARFPKTLDQLANDLADQLLEFTSLDHLCNLATSRPFSFPSSSDTPRVCADRPLRIAAAWDDTCHCYLPDALDELQLLGAEIVDFAPSRCEDLPENVDVVFFGSGHVTEDYLRSLAANACLQGALRAHVCRNKVVYAEGTGAAILAQAVETPDGELIPMTGILSAVLRVHSPTSAAQPIELEPARKVWVFQPGVRMRGYLSEGVRFCDIGAESVVAQARCENGPTPVVLARKNCVASLAYFHLGADPEALAAALLAAQTTH